MDVLASGRLGNVCCRELESKKKKREKLCSAVLCTPVSVRFQNATRPRARDAFRFLPKLVKPEASSQKKKKLPGTVVPRIKESTRNVWLCLQQGLRNDYKENVRQLYDPVQAQPYKKRVRRDQIDNVSGIVQTIKLRSHTQFQNSLNHHLPISVQILVYTFLF